MNYTKAQGTYLAWLDVNGLMDKVGAREKAAEENRTSESRVTPEQIMQRWFAENARIYLNPGHSYGTGGDGHAHEPGTSGAGAEGLATSARPWRTPRSKAGGGRGFSSLDHENGGGRVWGPPPFCWAGDL